MPDVSEEPGHDLAAPPRDLLRNGEHPLITVEMLSLAMYGAASAISMRRGGAPTKLHFLRCVAEIAAILAVVALILRVV